jgi:hypothetical protein
MSAVFMKTSFFLMLTFFANVQPGFGRERQPQETRVLISRS